MAKKKKYYVIWEGTETGIFDSWDACKLRIKGYPNAKYKSFPSEEAAKEAYHADGYEDHIIRKEKKQQISLETFAGEIEWNSISVDAACSGNPGDLEYRGVETANKNEIFRMGPFRKGTNNIGEFLALVHGLALLKNEGKPMLAIYSDSRIAMGWIKAKKARTKLVFGKSNQKLKILITRAEKWLRENEVTNPIMKWETKRWGEIPADFGRK